MPGWMPKKPRYEMTPEEKRIDNKERKAREMFKKAMRGEIPMPEGGFPLVAPKLETNAGETPTDENENPFVEPLLTEDPFLEDDPLADPLGDPFAEPIEDLPADPSAMDSGAATGMPRPLRKRRADMTPEERRASNQDRKRREMHKKARQTEHRLTLQQQLQQAGFTAVEVEGGGCLVQAGPSGPPSWGPPSWGPPSWGPPSWPVRAPRGGHPRMVPAIRPTARVPFMGQPHLGGDMRWQPPGLGGFMSDSGPDAQGTRKRKLRSDMTPEEKRADNAERRARAAAKQAAQAQAAAALEGIADPLGEAQPEEPQWLA